MNLKRLITIIAVTLLFLQAATLVSNAEEYRWQINYQHVILDIQKDGNVDMLYEVDADIVKGHWDEVWIPRTTRQMTVHYVEDGSGDRHDFMVDGDQIKVKGFDLSPGENVNLKIYSTLNSFVFASNMQGYDIVTFTPPWWDMTIMDTRVKFYLPGNISKEEVFTGNREYDNFLYEDGRSAVYFESDRLTPNEQFTVAVSFPDSYMEAGTIKPPEEPYYPGTGTGMSLFDTLCNFSCCPMVFIFMLFIFIMGLAGNNRRRPYSSPTVSMDGVGINKDLDPAEAATLLRIDPGRVFTIIMFGLMKKGNVKLISTEPIRLEVVSRKSLKYYEKLFVDSIKDNRLDEDGLLECFKVLARRVVDKTRPYCRRDTEDYYREKIDQAWSEIKAVDTPGVKLDKYDTNMIWLMADEQFAEKTRDYISRAPGSDTVIVPSHYWWYPYYFGLPHYGQTTPTTGEPVPSQPSSQPPQPVNTTTSTVESFANRVSDSVESFSSNVVTGVEKFLGVRNEANAPPPASSMSGRPQGFQGKTSCACVSCACACVSCACACACAGGGGGCT